MKYHNSLDQKTLRRLQQSAGLLATLVPVAFLAACGGGAGTADEPTQTAQQASVSTPSNATIASLQDTPASVPDSAAMQSFTPGTPVVDETALPTLPPDDATTLPGTTLDTTVAAAPTPTSTRAGIESLITSSGPVAVQATDVVYNASASNVATYEYAALQCNANNYYWWIWGGSSGRLASPLPDPLASTTGGGPSYATVASPGESTKKAFQFTLNYNDPYTPSGLTNSRRCEINYAWQPYTYPGRLPAPVVGLPRNKDFWWGTSVRVPDWTKTVDQQIVWQWHDGSSIGFNPLLSLIVKGSQLKLMVAYDTHSSPSVATSTTLYPWTGSYTPNTWMKFVVKSRVDMVTPTNSYATVYLNGTKIMDYHGPIGYNVPYTDYAKVGIYHWLNGTNAWDMTVPSRTAWYKGPTQVYDRSGYTAASISAIMD